MLRRVGLVLPLVILVGQTLGLEPRATCKEGELYCSSGCSQVMLCAGSGNPDVTLSTCQAGYLCDSASNLCKNASEVTCTVPPSETEYTCREAGVFPNPYDCHSYFTCTQGGMNATATQCMNSSSTYLAYDPLSETCRLGPDSRVCVENPLPACKTQGQSGAVYENPNIYYYCYLEGNSLVHWMFRCSDPTQIFLNGICQQDTSTITTSTTASSTTSTSTSTNSTTASTPPPCTQPNTVLPDPNDCHSFYLCTSSLTQIHQKCRDGYYFNQNAVLCLPGECK